MKGEGYNYENGSGFGCNIFSGAALYKAEPSIVRGLYENMVNIYFPSQENANKSSL